MREPLLAPPRSTISAIHELPSPLRSTTSAVRGLAPHSSMLAAPRGSMLAAPRGSMLAVPRSTMLAAPRGSMLAVVVALAMPLFACGNVDSAAMADAPLAPTADAAPDATAPTADAALNRCAPATCLLADEFDSANLDPSLWGVTLQGGATAKVSHGILTLHLPATPEAFADVYSLVGFPAGTTFLASVTFSSGQFYDHKGVGFSSSGISADCFSGETEAAMFRGQDGDSYTETKLAGTSTCTLMTKDYQAGTHAVKIVRDADRVVFTQNDVALDPITTHVPTGLLPIRFTAYTYETAPGAAVQIDVDWVAVTRN